MSCEQSAMNSTGPGIAGAFVVMNPSNALMCERVKRTRPYARKDLRPWQAQGRSLAAKASPFWCRKTSSEWRVAITLAL